METFIGRLHLVALRNLNARNSVLLEQGDLLPHLVVGSAFRVLVGPSAHGSERCSESPSEQCLT